MQNATSAARKLLELSEDELFRTKFKEKGFKFASNYSWEEIGADDTRILNEI